MHRVYDRFWWVDIPDFVFIGKRTRRQNHLRRAREDEILHTSHDAGAPVLGGLVHGKCDLRIQCRTLLQGLV